jgi:Tfp pilus assembly protein PilO
MNRWPLALSLLLARLGRGPVLLAAAALLAAGVWGLMVPAATRASMHQQLQLDALRQSASQAPRPAAPVSTQGTALEAFERRLANDDVVTAFQRQLWQQAEAAGLQLNKVDYRSEGDAGAQFTRLSITLPATGTYPGVRRFIFALMAQFPGLALDRLDLKRSSATGAEVEATMHFTLLRRP